MKTIKMILFTGFLVLSFVSTANAGKPAPVFAANCGAYFGSEDPPVVGSHDAGHYCAAELSDLCGAIDVAGSLSSSDEDTMVSKTIGADIKFEEGKFADAQEDKLDKIDAKLISLLLSRKTKISDEDFDDISVALEAAQVCVSPFVPL